MSLETDLQTLLKAASGITTLVGKNPRASNDPSVRRERLYQSDVLPAIEIHIEDDQAVNTLEAWDGTSNAHVVFSCIANEQGIARQIGEACISLLEPFVGATTSGRVESVTYLRTRNAFAPYEDGSDDGEHVAEVHLQIWYHAN